MTNMQTEDDDEALVTVSWRRPKVIQVYANGNEVVVCTTDESFAAIRHEDVEDVTAAMQRVATEIRRRSRWEARAQRQGNSWEEVSLPPKGPIAHPFRQR